MMKVFITNLGRYNEGTLCGTWINLPIADDELSKVMESIGIGKGYEEYFITDCETDIEGFKIGEYMPIWELNEIAEAVESFSECEKLALQAMLECGYIERNAIDKVKDGDYRIYEDCSSMEHVAMEIVEESGLLESIPKELRYYFDYEAYGIDLDIEGNYIYVGNSVYVEIL